MKSMPTPATGPQRALVLQFRRLNMAMLGVYGNEWTWTRTLDRLATRGIVFDQHYASTTNARDAKTTWQLGEPDLIHRLNRAGVCTVRIRTDGEPAAPAGWVIDEPTPVDTRPDLLRELRHHVYATVAQVPANAPALLWIELDPFVAPWRPTNEWLQYYFESDDDEDEPIAPWFDHVPTSAIDDNTFERLQTTYAAMISSVDQALTKLFSGCRARGFGKNGLTIVSAELGEPLGENGLVGRQADTIGEALVHLPLILRLPGNAQAGRRISKLTQPAAVAATLLDHFGIETSGQPRSLLKTIDDTKPNDDGHIVIHGRDENAIRTADHFLIAPTPPNPETARLFHKPEDRWEFNDMAKKQEFEVERLLSLL